MNNFGDFREAARKGITTAGGFPVLVEDFPSLTKSSRNACLDGVASCDVYSAVIGERGGWTAPSGKLVVEEEFEEAVRRGIPVVVFVQQTTMDDDAKRLSQRLSDYLGGYFRKTFNTPDELQTAVTEALKPVVQSKQSPRMDVRMLSNKLQIPRNNSYSEVKLRFVLAPERVEEVIDPVMLDDERLQRELYAVAHAAGVDLLSYEKPKEHSVGTDTLVIIQRGKGRGNSVGNEDVRIELTTKGVLTIDCDVTGHREAQNARSFMAFSYLLESDVTDGLNKCFGFAKAFFDWKDPRVLRNSCI